MASPWHTSGALGWQGWQRRSGGQRDI